MRIVDRVIRVVDRDEIETPDLGVNGHRENAPAPGRWTVVGPIPIRSAELGRAGRGSSSKGDPSEMVRVVPARRVSAESRTASASPPCHLYETTGRRSMANPAHPSARGGICGAIGSICPLK